MFRRPLEESWHAALAPLRDYEVTLDEAQVFDQETGRGSYGAVFKSKLNGADCAVKKIHEILVGYGGYDPVNKDESGTLLKKFLGEIKLLSQQRHPNIVQFLGVCNLDVNNLGSISLVMEYMETSLKDFIPHNQGVLRLGTKISILKDVASGVSHLHSQGIIHRDLNAGNVLLTSTCSAKVADLGVARVAQSIVTPGSMTVAPGATEFMPPEALRKVPMYGPKLDVFSFGHLALFLLNEVRSLTAYKTGCQSCLKFCLSSYT